MSATEIITVGSPRAYILGRQSRIVTSMNQDIRKLIQHMLEIVIGRGALGLAAIQIGVQKRIVVVRGSSLVSPVVMVNPIIIGRSKETDVALESCLSIPDKEVPVRRHVAVTVRHMSGRGATYLTDTVARVVQHEIDHLDGILMIDKEEPNVAPPAS